VDIDVVRILNGFASEAAAFADGEARSLLIGRTQAALRAALTSAAGHPYEEQWSRLYREGQRLIASLSDPTALPWLRAFLVENEDLCDEAAELVRL
jgi:hypothetical protein